MAGYTLEQLRDAFFEGMEVGAEDADASMRPIVGGYGVQGPSDPDVLWRRSDAFKAAMRATPAGETEIDRFTQVTRDMARSV